MPLTRKRTPKKTPTSKGGKKTLPYSGPPDPDLDGHGRIRQWSATSQDGNDLKTYIEHGCDEGLGMEMLKEKFPQFKKYNPSTSALQFRTVENPSMHKYGIANRLLVSILFFYIYIFVISNKYF